MFVDRNVRALDVQIRFRGEAWNGAVSARPTFTGWTYMMDSTHTAGIISYKLRARGKDFEKSHVLILYLQSFYILSC